MFLLGTILGVVVGMFLMSCISINTINEKDSLIYAKTKALENAETKVEERNKFIKNQSKDIKTLRNKIVDLENNIELLVNNSRNAKIKELVTDGKSEN